MTAASRLPAGAHVVIESIDSNQDLPPPAAVSVLWRGQDILALYKAAGVHSESGRGGLTVAAFLEAEVPGALTIGQREAEAGLVHRLDRDTSGLLLAATTTASYQRLRNLFAGAEVEKTYLALVEGSVQRRFQVDIPLARRRTRVVRATRRDRSMQALTRVYPLLVRSNWSLVSVVIKTGVTHQVRAHLAMSGYPVIGDSKYCAPPAPPATRQGQLLHATTIALPGGPQLSAAVPVDFVKAYAALLGTTRS